jgi:predicted DNA-binding transcriptional regulator YafY
VAVEHPIGRVLATLELLQARGWLGADELSRRLEVDRRTVRRYVTTLRELGIPVEARPGRVGGYRLRPGFRLPPLMLTDDEALAVILGLLAARRVGLAATAPATESALAKLERVLPLDLREPVLSLDQAVEFTLRGSRPVPASTDILLRLGVAAHRQRRVRISYRNFQGEASERHVDPYGLVFHAGRWYLVGWDHSRRHLRTFRCDRIASLVVEDQAFARPTDFDSAEAVSRSLASVPWGVTVEVLLRTTLEAARRRVGVGIAVLDPVPGGVRLRMGADGLDWAARYLVSLELPFQVVGPPGLRDALRRLADEIAEVAHGKAFGD